MLQTVPVMYSGYEAVDHVIMGNFRMFVFARMRGFVVALLALSLMAGCTVAPVQEMSDARQAIMAAQDAGASTASSKIYFEAKASMGAAELALDVEDYKTARQQAIEARQLAIQARDAALKKKSEQY